NIGKPALEIIDQLNAGTLAVLEMSSYQLMDVTRSPQIAVVTALFPEHLNYHGSFPAYVSAKQNIIRFQQPGDKAYYAALPGMDEFVAPGAGQKIPYTDAECPVAVQETQLLGA